MRFYLGSHHPIWLTRMPGIPLMISHRRLAGMRTLPEAVTDWALDSGGFTELTLHGHWHTSPHDYLRAIRRYTDQIGRLAWAAPQDWMCEPAVLSRTGLTITAHQRRTVGNFLTLRHAAADLPIIPVLQGWSPDSYLRTADMYQRAGIDLAAEPLVGVGSICRRTSHHDLHTILARLAELGLSLHGFGVKSRVLTATAPLLTSADSLAWSKRGRYVPGCSPSHATESNCQHFATAWHHAMLSKIPMSAPRTTGVRQ